ncbi:cysteine rich repeat-containing protein [Amorphus orientalis]|uniref:Cysteine rich repeat-containing protein n=1 Tax=Amorphus orientalis TaxID=649198 RepID=A0AAE3VLV9_9HYPH|nr:cysteine rich repeat-containing protein [Amorphus orientalis]MDQ0314076.1 hypothetical protein [Amorphus orientalis]
MIRSIVVAGFAIALSTGAVLAQSGPQSEAIRSACKDDVERLCSTVEPIAVPECLREHVDEVSDGCKSTIAEVQREDEAGHD